MNNKISIKVKGKQIEIIKNGGLLMRISILEDGITIEQPRARYIKFAGEESEIERK